MKWNQIAVALLVGLFLGTILGSSPMGRNILKGFGKPNRQERLLKKFSSRLDLTSEQREKVRAILEAKRSKVDALFAEAQPRFEAMRKETGDEIKKVLTPAQTEKFEKLDAEMEQRFKDRFHSR